MIDRILNDKYKITEQFDTGGMAIVYKGIDLATSETIAIKVLKPELAEDKSLLKRFDQEARAASSLSHPNIVKVRDVGCDGDIHYIVLDFIDGITLKKYIEKKGPLNPYEAAEIALEIAQGLSNAHENRIIHRDIKPQNIIIQRDKSVKITDFGIARVVDDTTHTTQYGKDIIGTVYYSSPEQVRGLNVDERSDIYSLGVVLYEMVTNSVPFNGETAVSIAMQHVTKDIDSPRIINKEVPAALENIIRNAMAKRVNDRYKSINSMIRDLKKFLNGSNSIPLICNAHNNIESTPKQKKPVSERQKEKQRKKINSLLMNAFLVILLSAVLTLLVYGIFQLGSQIFENNFVISTVEAPSVVGMSSDEARTALQKKQLIYREVSFQYSSKIPQGCVIEQSPAEGEILNEDDLVNVVISLGAFSIDIPNFEGKELAVAEMELISNRYIVLGKTRYVESDAPEGTIISQSIAPGEFSLEGNSVTITFEVSLGSEKTTIVMKNLLGLTQTTAEQFSKIYDFVIGRVRYEYSDTVEKDKIISQSIQPGDEVEKGSIVDIVVSLGPQSISKQTLIIDVPDNVELDDEGTVMLRVRYLAEGSFKDEFVGRIEVVDSQIKLTVENYGTVVYYIYINDKLIGSQEIKFS